MMVHTLLGLNTKENPFLNTGIFLLVVSMQQNFFTLVKEEQYSVMPQKYLKKSVTATILDTMDR
jgi:hypothetical protein